MDDLHAVVERGYDAIADRYASNIASGRGPETYFRAFLDRVVSGIPRGGRVLDLGCGAGLVASELSARSRVVGVDRSRAQLSLARVNAPKATLVRADISEVAFAPDAFDAVIAFWSLIHVRRDRHADVLRSVRSWLKPRGVFAGTLGTSDSPEDRDDDFFGAPMSWSHFDAETNRRLLREVGFELIEADEIADEGETPLWVIATA